MLQQALEYWKGLDPVEKTSLPSSCNVSTDEVFGSLGPTGAFTEETPYDPSSPYSASTAGSDHLCPGMASCTYGLLVVPVTNCSNNYGPYYFPEKLIPLTIQKALAGEPLPVYGRGENVRDLLYVDDHARALRAVLERGAPGRTYNVGVGTTSAATLSSVVRVASVRLLDELRPDPVGPHERLIAFVADRPGHDQRYAIDSSRLQTELGWQARQDIRFRSPPHLVALDISEHPEWVARVAKSSAYRGERLGAGDAA